VTCCGIPACGNKTDEDHQHYSGSPVIGVDGIMITDAATTGPDVGIPSVEASTTLNNISGATASPQNGR